MAEKLELTMQPHMKLSFWAEETGYLHWNPNPPIGGTLYQRSNHVLSTTDEIHSLSAIACIATGPRHRAARGEEG